ncbi:MAG: HDIG domain-containing protein [Syntrophobacterales bacterium]|nr:HDIG domain-containing protein [Syntrophobacterales bacterium]
MPYISIPQVKNNYIPTREECLELMLQVGMPPHIMEHSFKVCEMAMVLAKLCVLHSYPISSEKVEAGALLHDIAKARCLEERCHHAIAGGEWLRLHGYHEVATIVEQHVNISKEDIRACPNESILVNYADKRVLHTSIVSLDERFDDLIRRYGKTSEHIRSLREKWKLYKELENRLSALLKEDVSKLTPYK